ncbi:restriction endonuclease subunit S [Candidatus Mycosynbacter amalyticus]|uniref:Restriction endonuclease subunit S n=1 Tax=Candidatus Mycosynbacter amalyticus TaxID=2665156 RepID=A0A857MNX3_9BACT|nr:restriction endonuclease subunit S [Candidatus Mycosynbacter amalyticus]QHN43292.1 restriction endonuclease subunit S [Candidatus Mycosynbacter amalyticus]
MGKIDQLIAELCPNGVQFKHIWEVTAWDKKFNAVDNKKQPKTYKYSYLLASALRKLAVEGGDVKLLSTGGEVYGYTTEELAGKNISEGEIISIPWGGRATVQYYNGKFVTADNRIATSLDKNYLDNKYLYYFMLSNLRTIQSFYRGSGIQHPSMAKVLDMKIPIPPIEVQKEIVQILDKFTQLEAELEAELEARRKQYEYYRNQLLTFDEQRERVRWLTLGEVCNISRGRVMSKDYLTENSGDYPVYSSQTANNGVFGKIKTYDYDLESITWTTDGANAGSVFYHNNEKFSITNVCGLLQVKADNLSTRFLFYALQLLTKPHVSAGMGNPKLMSNVMAKIKVPIPSIEEQDKIVNILDNFDSLVNGMTEGLPAEIKARRQQYDYYRTKLLTFQEATA